MIEHFDVLIVGAGISGIGAAYHLQTSCPSKRFAILERRERIGGTWDLFRYPGIRSDSDMHTLGFAFRPWSGEQPIADGPGILRYLEDTARNYGIDRKIRFGQSVESARWSSRDARWTLGVRDEASAQLRELSCTFLLVCAGYYDYDRGYTPAFAGIDAFQGKIVHPQHWPEDLELADKRVIVIGSGATAVTLVPALAELGARVTMLQRSPSYVMALPRNDAVMHWLGEHLPEAQAQAITRWKNIALSQAFYWFCRAQPKRAKQLILAQARKHLGPGFDVDTHFTPDYDPWDQRLCIAPGGDLFEALASGRASIVTDHIERFTERGILLRSGAELDADIIVTATGLQLRFLGGISLDVDGQRIDPHATLTYRGMMCSGVPNMALCVGYTNASWTLKVDLTCAYVCRLLEHMDEHDYAYCLPRNDDPRVQARPLLDFDAGYVRRGEHLFPQQGSREPWHVRQNYVVDRLTMRFARLDDGVMRFVSRGQGS
jgi:monooxygenase